MAAYSLTLTTTEREAIDWVGNRYSHGYDLRKILLGCEMSHDEWDSDEIINFGISESQAWEIRELLKDSNFDCFASFLVKKLQSFLQGIV